MWATGEPAVAGLVAVVVALAIWRRSIADAAMLTLAASVLVRRWTFTIGLVVVASFATVRSVDAVESLEPTVLGPFTGWTTVAGDPQPGNGATRIVVQVEGERFEMWVRGRAAALRVARWQQGDRAWVVGERRALTAERAGRVAWQHIVGAFEYDTLGDVRDGRPLAAAANRVRDLIERGTSSMPPADAALARGLVIGDDRDQPREMIDRFRASGLSHLTAVSGQNVAFVLAAVGPLLRRARTGPRLAMTVALIGWFVVLTRAEPSVLRAGVMAGLSAVAFALGRERDPPRLLAVAVIGLLLVDPLLGGSVGFWLSVGATAGVTVIGPPLARRLHVLGPLALPLGVTLGAQAGVMLPSLFVFGRLSLVGTAANLVAVPVAGFVMLYGLPASLVAGALPVIRGPVMLPVFVGVRWVDRVATVSAGLEPHPPWNWIGWLAVVTGVVVLVLRRPPESDDDTELSE